MQFFHLAGLLLVAVIGFSPLTLSLANAGEADVLNVRHTKTGANTYRFDVTVKHADTGWKHYANAFEIVGPDGKVLGKRTLWHPHVNEQPFTRSLSGVKIPADIKEISIRAVDSVHGTGGKEMKVKLGK